MMNIIIMPLISTVVSLIFAVTVLDQFFARRKPYLDSIASPLFTGSGSYWLIETSLVSH